MLVKTMAYSRSVLAAVRIREGSFEVHPQVIVVSSTI